MIAVLPNIVDGRVTRKLEISTATLREMVIRAAQIRKAAIATETEKSGVAEPRDETMMVMP